MTAKLRGRLGVEGLSKRKTDSWTHTAVHDRIGVWHVRGLNGNGKNTIKILHINEEMVIF